MNPSRVFSVGLVVFVVVLGYAAVVSFAHREAIAAASATGLAVFCAGCSLLAWWDR